MRRSTLAVMLLDPRFQSFCYRSALVIYLLILVLGSIPGARHEIGEYAPGGVLHALAYSGLTVLLFIGKGTHLNKRAIGAVLMVAAMGAGDEFVQSFLPYRGAAVFDWLVDIAASLTTATAMYFLYPRLTRRVSETAPAPTRG